MNQRELAKSLIDRIPEGKLPYIVAYLEGACVTAKTPGDEAAEIIKEAERVVEEQTAEAAKDAKDAVSDALRTLREFLKIIE